VCLFSWRCGLWKELYNIKSFGYDGKVAVSPMGAKILNSDLFFERFLKREGLPLVIDLDDKEVYAKQSQQRALAKEKVALQQSLYIDGMLPLILDGTGRDVDKIIRTELLS